MHSLAMEDPVSIGLQLSLINVPRPSGAEALRLGFKVARVACLAPFNLSHFCRHVLCPFTFDHSPFMGPSRTGII